MSSERSVPPEQAVPAPGDRGRTAVWLEAYAAVYVEIPKVACSSLKLALAALLDVDLTAAGGDPHRARFPELPARPGPRLYPGAFAFAFVRNPWDRLVSCYRDKIRGEVRDFTAFDPARGVAYCLARFDAFRPGMPFEAFVRAVASIGDDEADPHFRSQHCFVTNAAGEIAIDHVGRFETLERDWRWVCQHLGIPATRLPVVQAAAPGRRYAEYYTPETRQLVAERFREDISLFGYSFPDT